MACPRLSIGLIGGPAFRLVSMAIGLASVGGFIIAPAFAQIVYPTVDTLVASDGRPDDGFGNRV